MQPFGSSSPGNSVGGAPFCASCHPLGFLSSGGTFLPYLGHTGEFQVPALSFRGWRRQQLVFGAGVEYVGRSSYGSRSLHSCGAILEDELSLGVMF